ncbi:MAG: uracil-DNA glycosylase family protein [Candidatus Binatia bacterium]
METSARKEIRAWLEREIALGLESLPRALEAGAESATRVAVASPPAETLRVAQVTTASTGAAVPARAHTQAREGRMEVTTASTRAAVPASTRDDASRVASALPDVLVEPAIRSATSLGELREVLGDCRRCKLCTGRANIVFGVGNPQARVMFIGEGPGEDEDVQGIPFVGKAGALLTDIITKGMKLRRDDVYIANVVKCRPPGNRDPQPDEIVACEPFLRRQIEIVRPEVIVSLGNFATQALLGDRTPISRRRGRWHDVGGIALMPTFHPSYLLRNATDKRLVWQDIQLVMERLGLPLPPRAGRA